MAVKIKLKRMGKIRAPYYRIVVADARTKRDGRAIEEIGKYHPKVDPSLIEVNSERAQYWLSVGAQPTNPVRRLFEITGDWQKFRGLPGAEGTLKTAAPAPDKKEAFAAAVAETLKDKNKAAEAKPDKGRSRKGADTAAEGGEPDKPARSGGRQAGGARGRAGAKGGAAEGKPGAASKTAADSASEAGGSGKDGAGDGGKPARGGPRDGAAAKAKQAEDGSADGAATQTKQSRGGSQRSTAGSASKGKPAGAKAGAGPDSEA